MATPGEDDVHVTSVFVEAAFDAVWDRITDPLEFPELYPSWTAAVEATSEGAYRGTGPDGDDFVIRPRLDREFGVVDFEVEAEGAVERSRSRLFDVSEDAFLLVHAAVRRAGIDDEGWKEHRCGTDDELERMKRLVESESPG